MLGRVARLGAAAMVTGACVGIALAGCGAQSTREGPPQTSPVAPKVTKTARTQSASDVPFRFFSSVSFWNEPVAANAPLAANSQAMVNAFAAEITSEEQATTGPWINTTSYSVPLYTVPANQPTVPVELHNHAPEAALSAAWSEVPLPANARPATGTDGDLVVWQPATNRLWEFWKLAHEGNSWHATWGGAMQNVSSQTGVYEPQSWPGAKTWWGVSATSLSLVGGLISLEDLQHGEINHALSMAIPNSRAETYASPAQRDDGKSNDPLSLPQGTHLRLNPNLNLATLHLPKLTLMLAQAAQRYGIIITDTSANITLYAQDPLPTTTNPYTGPNGYFEGKYPRELLTTFPWNQLQILRRR
jgi:hypothetical protein